LNWVKIIKLPTGTFEYDPSKPLGRRGGFGEVFAGKAASGGEVAIKKLHISAADAAHRELRIAEELKGREFEHVVPFIDAGEDADTGDYFVVMLKAEGSLQTRLDTGGVLAAAEAAAVLLQIVKGLIEVGELVHRDLKPDNVLLHEGKWKIADFGIARFVQEATASNTLKACLSPRYAAPEQWRSERATHSTDIYALGCVGFCLLTGKPPFCANPEQEHQNAPLPSFDCTDSRLRSLVNMALRKVPETRPVLSRVRSLLEEIVLNPHKAGDEGPLTALAGAAAKVATQEQQIQAQQNAKAAAREARLRLANGGFEILSENAERLWGKIHSHAPNAERMPGRQSGLFQCNIGNGWLLIHEPNHLEPGGFPQSGWEVVAFSQIRVRQFRPEYDWSASLWFMKPKGAADYRWHEASYWSLAATKFEPRALGPGREADLVASNTICGISFAFGPCIIDDEHEDQFHERWIWLLSKAAVGELRPPSSMPFGWPPRLL
jgi:eukaryotic-like serine/threonine-protein kinase